MTVRAYSVGQIRDLLTPLPVHAQRDEVASGRRARETAELRTCDLLLIDDITSAKITDWFREEMHKLIDARVSSDRRRTIITLNATSKEALASELVDRLGAPITSRLRDDSVFAWLDGIDHRSFSGWDPFAEDGQ